MLEGLLDHAHAMREASNTRRTPRPRRARVTGNGGVPSGDSNDLIRRRIAAAKGEGPPVEAAAPSDDLRMMLTVLDGMTTPEE